MPDNGMAERFNGRIEREVLTITVGSHRDLERLLKGYNQAYNWRRFVAPAAASQTPLRPERADPNNAPRPYS
ncbi:MAG: hypothetical protein AVDCRST_MAG40-136 [uncultured Gemmatimonadaceae bacterium]|uniref:Uncharacterized protein n=1 Tax=uncultured Gemmatimonadaceae bacterium TaxID=246130 RepID=A0A6J4K7M0_9BACT|nr:MAG: hypothetical protein AVDCRST_MAG40-136 [uncultured Gemmatimonadaceae bacterium]